VRLPWSSRPREPALPELPRAAGPVRAVERTWRALPGEGPLQRIGLPGEGVEAVGRLVHVATVGPGLARPGDLPEPVASPLHGVAELVVCWQGSLEHRDSLGHRGVVRAGGVKLVAGGGGVEAEVGASRDLRRDGGDLEWLSARWVQAGAPAVPTVRLAEVVPRRRQGRAVLHDLVGPEGAVTDPGGTVVVRVQLPAGATADLPVAPSADVVVVVLDGAALLGEALAEVPTGHLAALAVGASRVLVATRLDRPADVVVLATPPSAGEVVRHGLIAGPDEGAVAAALEASRSPGFGTLPSPGD
jgi:redox-sensitive bicupin YhaK (pirin superfamily)